ncbi:hypothetical protein [Burkholderia ambifaria]|jgi:hypothetical protein|uniref:hypothetical protein n=1 Tax=Burkholderia ambifaria TaxID=152480 RepID=UPI001588CB1B|nr:hypothetical protein [Burkholderia ambifaria]
MLIDVIEMRRLALGHGAGRDTADFAGFGGSGRGKLSSGGSAAMGNPVFLPNWIEHFST